MINENFIQLYENSFRENWALPALTDYGEKRTFTYAEMAKQIARLHLLFEEAGIREGDRIALIGKDCIHWCVVYFATITYGAVIVPILQDFNPNDVQHIINHSGSVLLFAGDRYWESIEGKELPAIRAVFSLADFRGVYRQKGGKIQEARLDERFAAKYPNGFSADNIRYVKRDNREVVLLNYTSGTTGFSKGVMLTGNNLAGNVIRRSCYPIGQAALAENPAESLCRCPPASHPNRASHPRKNIQEDDFAATGEAEH